MPTSFKPHSPRLDNADNTEPLGRIMRILRCELATYQELEGVLEKHQCALLASQLEEMAKHQHRIEALTQEAKHLEGQRVECMTSSWGHPLSLRSLIDTASTFASRHELEALREALNSSLDRITQWRDQTRALLMRSEQWVQDALQFWLDLIKPAPATYTPDESGRCGTQGDTQQASLGISTIIREA